MKKQCYALAFVLGLAGFAASANVAVGVVPQSKVVHWATVVFCDDDGDRIDEICVEGHTGFVVREFVDVTLSALPGTPPTRFLAQ
ncbi:MAG: hypothetical protein F4029_12715 [Gammaproteobacteria bacterium]|nr:hypothetical protein [Gammaproteobacteria bacterium]MXY55189.1 hypothetical protein [Gammaproteobacteria bacterium]MYF31561.1 hypothetical protein [Gammaproteobacteria bacterium]MYK47078.1 hypothetical protein [Gammaproteobacteria bacterium]